MMKNTKIQMLDLYLIYVPNLSRNNFFVIIRLFISLKKIRVIHCVLDIFDLDTKTLGSSTMSCIWFLMMSCYNDSDIL